MSAAAALLLILQSGTVFLTDDPHPVVVTLGGGPERKWVLGPAGKPLYSFDGIGGTNRECATECLKAWPPLMAKAGDAPVGDWSPKPMAFGGGLQWTYKGGFVYGFAGDTGADKAAGDDVGNIWHALVYVGAMPKLPLPGAASVVRRGTDFILADLRGHPLYTFAHDSTTPACRAECLQIWPPLLAPAMAGPVGAWAPIDRPDGVRQWAYAGRPVYTFSDDVARDDARGAGAGGVWSLVEVTAGNAAAKPRKGSH